MQFACVFSALSLPFCLGRIGSALCWNGRPTQWLVASFISDHVPQACRPLSLCLLVCLMIRSCCSPYQLTRQQFATNNFKPISLLILSRQQCNSGPVSRNSLHLTDQHGQLVCYRAIVTRQASSNNTERVNSLQQTANDAIRNRTKERDKVET